MARRYLGYGYTNAQGIAKLEYDADDEELTHSYTGVGAGKVDIVAESGSLQSETYSIIDAKAICSIIAKTSELTATLENGTLTLGTDGTNYGVFYFSSTTSNSGSYAIEVGDAVEFTLVSWTGTTTFRLDGTSNLDMLITTGAYTSDLTGTNNKIKIVNGGSSIYLYINGTLKYTSTNKTSESRKFRIRVNNEATAVIKDLMYYPTG